MTDDLVKRYRNSREWLNDGECCGDKDSDGVCAAPACIFGEAVKELQNAADRIEKLEAALRALIEANDNGWHPMKINGAEWFTARKALEGKDD
jgi:hypothetical protein